MTAFLFWDELTSL